MLNKNIYRKVKDIIILVLFCIAIFWFGKIALGYLRSFFIWINQVASKMDAVVAVALITGSLSVLGVVISSIISKILEYRQNTKRYLYEKKEEPYLVLSFGRYSLISLTKNDKISPFFNPFLFCPISFLISKIISSSIKRLSVGFPVLF